MKLSIRTICRSAISLMAVSAAYLAAELPAAAVTFTGLDFSGIQAINGSTPAGTVLLDDQPYFSGPAQLGTFDIVLVNQSNGSTGGNSAGDLELATTSAFGGFSEVQIAFSGIAPQLQIAQAAVNGRLSGSDDQWNLTANSGSWLLDDPAPTDLVEAINGNTISWTYAYPFPGPVGNTLNWSLSSTTALSELNLRFANTGPNINGNAINISTGAVIPFEFETGAGIAGIAALFGVQRFRCRRSKVTA